MFPTLRRLRPLHPFYLFLHFLPTTLSLIIPVVLITLSQTSYKHTNLLQKSKTRPNSKRKFNIHQFHIILTPSKFDHNFLYSMNLYTQTSTRPYIAWWRPFHVTKTQCRKANVARSKPFRFIPVPNNIRHVSSLDKFEAWKPSS